MSNNQKEFSNKSLPNFVNRKRIVDQIPEEGSLLYKTQNSQRNVRLKRQGNDAVLKTFLSKSALQIEGQRTAKILLGAPGAGKSYWAWQAHQDLAPKDKAGEIFVSYDEHGALFALPPYTRKLARIIGDFTDEHKPVSSETRKERKKLWEDYRPASQHIQNEILKRAALENYNLVIDSTSSSTGALKLIETLKNLGYRVEVTGFFAPFNVSADRVHNRARPAGDKELITKRIGDPRRLHTDTAYTTNIMGQGGPANNIQSNLMKAGGALNMINAVMEAADSFEYYYNPNNQSIPKIAFSKATDKSVLGDPALFKSDAKIIEQIKQDLHFDMQDMMNFLKLPNNDVLDKEWMRFTHAHFEKLLNNIANTHFNHDIDYESVMGFAPTRG